MESSNPHNSDMNVITTPNPKWVVWEGCSVDSLACVWRN